MNILTYLCSQFFNKEYVSIIALLLISLILSLFYTNLASIVTANIIEGVQKNNRSKTNLFFQMFICVSIIYFIILYIYKYVQNSLLTKITHWSKGEIFNFILLANNSNMRNINFVEFITPITRISNSLYLLFNDIISHIIPSFAFLLIIGGYLFMKDLKMGIIFTLTNICIFGYFWYNYKNMIDYKKGHEEISVSNEKYILDSLNNIDKIIYRGQVHNEISIYKEKTDKCIDYTIKMFNYMTNHTFVANMFAYSSIIYLTWRNIELYFEKKIDVPTFITIFTILIMYRDGLS